MRKTVLVSSMVLSLCAASQVLASGAMSNVQPVYFDGWFAGVGAGIEHLTSDTYNTVAGNEGDEHFAFGFHNELGDTNPDVGILAGFGKVFQNTYYLGGEVFGRYSHATIDSINNTNILTLTSHLTTDYAYGGALRLGYQPSVKTLIYVLAGVESAKLDQHVSKVDDKGEGNAYDFTKQAIAFMPGVGIETMLTDHVSLRGQYTYADYPSFSRDEALIFSDKNKGGSVSDKVNTKRGLYELDLVYHWNNL